MGDRRVPFYNMVNKILEETLLESGWSPLIKRTPVSPSPDLSSMDEMQEELNRRLKITINNNCITNGWDEPFHPGQRSVSFDMDDSSVQTVNRVNNSQPITDTPPTAVISKKSIGEKRKERFLKEKQAVKNINNNYISGLLHEPPNQSHTQVLAAFSKNSRKWEIPEGLRLLLKQSLKTMPLMILDGFEPSRTCTCEGPIRIIQCRMCGAQVETNCYLHQAVGNNGTMATRCSQPTCCSGKLIELRID